MRSQNEELHLGTIDGSYKQVVKDRGGVVENTTAEARRDLSWIWYGVTETPMPETPEDGKARQVDRFSMGVPSMAMYEVG